MNPVVFIPAYVSARRYTDTPSVTATFDHMTPMVEQGTMARCLESLKTVRGLGKVIIPVVAEPAIANQAAAKYRKIAALFPDLDITVISEAESAALKRRIGGLGFTVKDEIGFTGYGSVRNLCLVVALLMGADSLIFMDDDEIVDDSDFLAKALYGLGKQTRKGAPIIAKTGFCRNVQGSWLAPVSGKWYDKHWFQPDAFNAWMSSVKSGPRLVRSGHALGGIMALHRDAFLNVAFDPWIPRGEDGDYALDLHLYGHDMWMDNQWSIVHAPDPERSEGRRFRQNVYRWTYEQRKLEFARSLFDLHWVDPVAMMPYPGVMLGKSALRGMAKTAALRSFVCEDKAGYKEAKRAAVSDAPRYAERNCDKYFDFQGHWPTLARKLDENRLILEAGQNLNDGLRQVPSQVRGDITGHLPKVDMTELTGRLDLAPRPELTGRITPVRQSASVGRTSPTGLAHPADPAIPADPTNPASRHAES